MSGNSETEEKAYSPSDQRQSQSMTCLPPTSSRFLRSSSRSFFHSSWFSNSLYPASLIFSRRNRKTGFFSAILSPPSKQKRKKLCLFLLALMTFGGYFCARM